MKLNNQVKPSKPTSLMGAIVSFFMMIFGIVFFVVLSKEEDFSDSEGILIPVFFILFILVTLFITVFNAWNFFSKKGVSVYEVNSEGDFNGLQVGNDIETRLKQLEKLKVDGLISNEEYTQKREEILKKL